MTKENYSGLTKEEQEELELLDNPQIEFMGPIISPAINMFFQNLKSRKARVIKLRVKMRIAKLGLNPDLNYNDYYKIEQEEENRFDERFKK
jgi:hypothetical protein